MQRGQSFVGLSQKLLENAKLSFWPQTKSLWRKIPQKYSRNCLANLYSAGCPAEKEHSLRPLISLSSPCYICEDAADKTSQKHMDCKITDQWKTEDPNTKLSLRSQGLPGRKQVKFLVVPSLSSFISQSPILSLRDLSCHWWELSTGWIITVAQNSTSEVASRAGRHASTLRETGWGGGRFWACWKPGHTAFLFTQGKGRNHWFCCKTVL